MASEFAKIETLQLADGEELLEIVHTSLDDLWKVDDWEYPQVIFDFTRFFVKKLVNSFFIHKCNCLQLTKFNFLKNSESISTSNGHYCSYYYSFYPNQMWIT